MFIRRSYIGRLSDGRWRVYSRKGRNLGTYSSREAAKKRLAEVEMFKHMDKKKKKKKRKRSFELLYNLLCKGSEADATVTYSVKMRELNKGGDKDKLEEFMRVFKESFDEAMSMKLEDPEGVALLQALQEVES